MIEQKVNWESKKCFVIYFPKVLAITLNMRKSEILNINYKFIWILIETS